MAGKKENRRRHMGFSLMELLVAVGVIGLLLGILFASFTAIKSSAKASQTRAMMGALNGLAGQYELKTGRVINHTTGTGAHTPWAGMVYKNVNNEYHKPALPKVEISKTIDASTSDDLYVDVEAGDDVTNTEKVKYKLANILSERFVFSVVRIPELKGLLQKSGSDEYLSDVDGADGNGDGFYEVRDAWGHSIIYVFNRKPGPVGDISGPSVDTNWLPTHPTPYFASPGPDGKWGIDSRSRAYAGLSAKVKQDNDRLTKDNIYSFELENAASNSN